MTVTPYRSGLRAGRDGFAQLLRAEWTKFRTVPGWVVAMLMAALVTVLLGVLFVSGSSSSCSHGSVEVECPTPPLGPGGMAVNDRFTFLHQPLTGDGSITVRLTAMTGIITYPPPNHDQLVPGLVPWAKAGVIVKESTEPGSAYAAVLLTGSHGVRMQHNFTGDTPGRPGGVSKDAPRWLRLVRAGDTLTGYESTDGKAWTKVGTARLAGLPDTVQIGLFANSPGDLTVESDAVAGTISSLRFTQTTAVFDQVSLEGATAAGRSWSQDEVGGDDEMTDWERRHQPPGVEESDGTFTVTGTGDIAPLGTDGGSSVERPLLGLSTGLIIVIVVAVMFATAEYRRGLIRTTFVASPRRGRLLAAKAVVIGAVTFVAGLVAAGVVMPLGVRILRGNGIYTLPVPWYTELRVGVGSAALLAVAAVFAFGLGALFRRSAAAVITAVGTIVVPYVLATVSVLPEGASEWLLRVSPAAGFAIQQSIPEYPQVVGHYAPVAGYYPLAPWAGFAVLCGYAALVLGLAVHQTRRRDA